MTAAQLREALERHIAPCANVNIIDLDVDYGELRGLPVGESAPLASQVAHDLARLLSALRPQLVVNVHQLSNPVFQGTSVAGRVSGVTTITLPMDDLKHSLWMADLPMVALQSKQNRESLWDQQNNILILLTAHCHFLILRLARYYCQSSDYY
jgi:hypothetical protein